MKATVVRKVVMRERFTVDVDYWMSTLRWAKHSNGEVETGGLERGWLVAAKGSSFSSHAKSDVRTESSTAP